MACYTPPLKETQKQVEVPLPILSPIPTQKVHGMGSGTSPCF